MEKIKFDSGLREYRLSDMGVLRFNPADPNLYARFLGCGDKIRQIEQELKDSAQQIDSQDAAAGVSLMAQADRKMKDMLGWVFGEQNDFDKILGGVSLLAIGANGQRVIVNLLSALQPALEEGARLCARQESQKALGAAQKRRAGRA